MSLLLRLISISARVPCQTRGRLRAARTVFILERHRQHLRLSLTNRRTRNFVATTDEGLNVHRCTSCGDAGEVYVDDDSHERKRVALLGGPGVSRRRQGADIILPLAPVASKPHESIAPVFQSLRHFAPLGKHAYGKRCALRVLLASWFARRCRGSALRVIMFGLMVGTGAMVSSHVSRPRTRSTSMRVRSDEPLPLSRFRSERTLMPARAETVTWSRFL